MDDKASSSANAGRLPVESENESSELEDTSSGLEDTSSGLEDESGSEYDEESSVPSQPEVGSEVVMEGNQLCEVITDVINDVTGVISDVMGVCDGTKSCLDDKLGAQPSVPIQRPCSPIYTTVQPSVTRRSACDVTGESLGTASNTSATYGSYSSTMAVSGQRVTKSLSLDWLPRVPKKQRCVQVSVMDEDFRTPKREMLFVDIEKVTEESRGLIFVDTAGEVVYRTCFDRASGAYGVVLERNSIIGTDAQDTKRIVGCLFNTQSTAHKDVWELRDAETGGVNAVIKLGKWQGFVKGCMHVHRGERVYKAGADIRIRRVRGSSDFLVQAELNGQVITTIRRGAGRGSALDHNIFSLFVAPYIDSVAIVSLFSCLMHIQLRHERPRSTSNIIAMLLAKEARQTGREIKDFAAEKTGVLGKAVKERVRKGVKASGLSEAKVFTTARSIRIGQIHSRPNSVTVRIPSSPLPTVVHPNSPTAAHLAEGKPGKTPTQTSAESRLGEKVYVKLATGAEKQLYILSDHAEAGVQSLTRGAQRLVRTVKEKHAEIRMRATTQLGEARG